MCKGFLVASMLRGIIIFRNVQIDDYMCFCSYAALPGELRFLPEKEFDLAARFLKNLAAVNSTNLLPIINWNVYEDTPKLLNKYLPNHKVLSKVR
jgi:hypothetical protein